MERVVALLCNPSAGGGRAARVLPEVEDALRELDVSFLTEVTRDLEHARALARAAAYEERWWRRSAATAWRAVAPEPRFLMTLPQVFRGTHVGHPAVRVLRASELHVEDDRRFAVYADGDPIGHTPTTIRVIPRAVRVLAPQ